MIGKLYIFGASIGIEIYSMIKGYANVSGFLDNSIQKQGQKILGLEVFSFDILTSQDIVLISSITYYDSIKNQLSDMGIDNYYRTLSADAAYHALYKFGVLEFSEYIHLSSVANLIIERKKQLTQERRKKILLINNGIDTLDKLAEVIHSDNEYIVDTLLFSFANALFNPANYDCKIVLKSPADISIFFDLCSFYDYIHIIWVDPSYSYCINEIKEKCNKLITTVVGSDLYRVDDTRFDECYNIYHNSDCITIPTKDMEDSLLRKYGEVLRRKTKLVRIGIEIFDDIKILINSECDKEAMKRKWGIPLNKKIIVYGHNATVENRHLEFLDYYIQVPHDDIFLVLPMTYPGKPADDYRQSVSNKLKDTGADNYCILDTFLTNSQIAELRLITDIFISMIKTDALSGSFQEFLYAGTVCVVGSWLPYKRTIFDEGCYYLTVDTFEELRGIIDKIIDNFALMQKQCECNREIIYNLSSWQSCKQWWLGLYD